MRASIRFLLGDEARELRDIDPTMTVLRYLREVEGRAGTKEGCAEGDCGACTVVVAAPKNGGLEYRAVNACIQFLPTLDGKQLLTVEDLKTNDGVLHPVQTAMVDQHGSQCGFCTPGFVMSLFAHHRQGGAPDRQSLDDALAGNLCRCTGYGPIIAAARASSEARPDRAHGLSDQEVIDKLSETAALDSVGLQYDDRVYFAPRSIDELAELYEARPDACLLAGGTDIGLWVTKLHRRLDTVIYLGDVAGFCSVDESGGTLRIGAGATYEDVLPAINAHYSDFGELMRRIGSRQIRNAGTVGGNIANGSPIGDTMPALIALGARLVLRRGTERRDMALEDYFVSYGKQDRQSGEFVERVDLPLHGEDVDFLCYKVSKRFDQDITAVLGAFAMRHEDGVVADARICYGGMAATPQRAAAAEAALIGQPWSEASVAQARAALAKDYAPIDDMRASAAYRLNVAQNLLTKLYVETSEPAVETRLVGARAHG